MFAKCVRDDQKDWADWLPHVTFCYNATKHSATKFAPFFILTGWNPICTVDRILPRNSQEQKTVPDYIAQVNAMLERINDTHTHTHTQPFYGHLGFCLGLPR